MSKLYHLHEKINRINYLKQIHYHGVHLVDWYPYWNLSEFNNLPKIKQWVIRFLSWLFGIDLDADMKALSTFTGEK